MKRTRRRRPMAGYEALTPEMISALRFERERTGVGVPELAAKHLDPAHGIKARHVHSWILGEAKTAQPAHYNHVLKTWQSLLSASETTVLNTAELRAAMKAERERTGISVYRLFQLMTGRPASLTFTSLNYFYVGTVRAMPRAHVDYIMATWRSLPTKPETVALTPEILEALRGHADRTGKGPQALLAGVRERPDGLSSTLAAKWLRGEASSARKDHLDFILKRYEAAATQTQPV